MTTQLSNSTVKPARLYDGRIVTVDGTAGTVHQVSEPVGSTTVCEEVLNRKRLFTSGFNLVNDPF
jgi:hypothetical protein